MGLKVTDVLIQFNGDSDASVWLKQANLTKSLLKLKDLAVVIPLFLDGPIFAVYDQIKEKRDADKINLALRTAFACDKFLAYDEFRNRQILFYLFSCLLTINLKLIKVHVEIKIVNKEAATKRSTLLHPQRQLCMVAVPLNKAM